MITRDLSCHYTIMDMAAIYGVSPSALKKYFEMVYGLPISFYLGKSVFCSQSSGYLKQRTAWEQSLLPAGIAIRGNLVLYSGSVQGCPH